MSLRVRVGGGVLVFGATHSAKGWDKDGVVWGKWGHIHVFKNIYNKKKQNKGIFFCFKHILFERQIIIIKRILARC